MRLFVLLGLAACSFEHGIPGVPGGGGGGGGTWDEHDGGPVDIDAPSKPIDAAIDGPCGDSDSDGICNNLDDWPCGVKPTAPSGNATDTRNSGQSRLMVSATNLDQTMRLAVATAGESLTLTFSYTIEDTACEQACIDQIEIGWAPGGRVKCVFDSAVSPVGQVNGNINTTITAPTLGTSTSAVYDLRVNLGQNFSCNYMGAMGWYDPGPTMSNTIAKLCVH